VQALPHLEADFPKLAAAGYDKTSDDTGRPPEPGAYNCIAWAASDPCKSLWWWPEPDSYWPPCINRREETIRCFVRTFHCLGYFVCASSHREFGFEKVVLYALHKSTTPVTLPQRWQDMQDWEPTHMARQLPDGTWTSKCGAAEDITHFTLDALESYGPLRYGCPVVYMKRLVPVSWVIRSIQWLAWKLEVPFGWR
jgi:hypothetical protein